MPSEHFLRPLVVDPTAGGHVLVIDGTAEILASTVEAAFDSESRKRGLLGRDRLAPDTALIIAPCSAVHTFGMRFPIDVIFAARDGRVMKIAHAVGPRRIAAAWNAFAAIEMAAGETARRALRIGDQLRVISAPPRPSPAPR